MSSRCIICNYCPSIDGRQDDNYMNEQEDTCVKCAGIIGETLSEYEWDELEEDAFEYIEVSIESTMPLEAPRKPVQGDLIGPRYVGSSPSSSKLLEHPRGSSENDE